MNYIYFNFNLLPEIGYRNSNYIDISDEVKGKIHHIMLLFITINICRIDIYNNHECFYCGRELEEDYRLDYCPKCFQDDFN